MVDKKDDKKDEPVAADPTARVDTPTPEERPRARVGSPEEIERAQIHPDIKDFEGK